MRASAWRGALVAISLLLPFASATAPANDAFANAISLGALPAVHSGSTQGATLESGEQKCSRETNGSVWYKWSGPLVGRFWANVTSVHYNDVAVFTGSSVSSLTLLSCGHWGCGTCPASVSFVAFSKDTTYYFRVSSISIGSQGPFTFSLECYCNAGTYVNATYSLGHYAYARCGSAMDVGQVACLAVPAGVAAETGLRLTDDRFSRVTYQVDLLDSANRPVGEQTFACGPVVLRLPPGTTTIQVLPREPNAFLSGGMPFPLPPGGSVPLNCGAIVGQHHPSPSTTGRVSALFW